MPYAIAVSKFELWAALKDIHSAVVFGNDTTTTTSTTTTSTSAIELRDSSRLSPHASSVVGLESFQLLVDHCNLQILIKSLDTEMSDEQEIEKKFSRQLSMMYTRVLFR